MDTGEGRMEKFEAADKEELSRKLSQFEDRYPLHGGVFKVGEELEIKGSRFLVKDISSLGMRLRVLPRKNKDTEIDPFEFVKSETCMNRTMSD